MKVKIQFTIDIDEWAWMQCFNLHSITKARADVKKFVSSSAVDEFRELGVLNEPNPSQMLQHRRNVLIPKFYVKGLRRGTFRLSDMQWTPTQQAAWKELIKKSSGSLNQE